jgi:hypothetical protein
MYIREAIHNFRDCCCNLYSSCSQRDATVDDSISIFWVLVYKISRCWVDVVIFYVLLFQSRVSGLMRFHNGPDSECASSSVQISEKV